MAGLTTRAVLCSLVALGLTLTAAIARELTFEERVAAQEAIERVYYSHRAGTSQPFDETVPRSVLEANPETYTEVLADHFSRHLEALQAGMK